ncbi:hypothetical protein POTOM_007561 [Populus tomentosa]|uniref:THH1/TOM1/TOM3 domain-containing protein n=1 Tax=Populus tomentosa TaxID=118781 RepID=A0A8X8AFG5_POPTO|nr:hypothetical protein POTOM_007561 [Populus tomentosa]
MPEVKPKNRRSKSTDYRSSVVVSPYTSLSSFPRMNIESNCSPLDLLIVNIALACIDGALACIAFSQAIYRPDILTKTNEGIRSELGFIQNGTLTRRDVYLPVYKDPSAKSTNWMDTPESTPSHGCLLQLGSKLIFWILISIRQVTSSTLYLQLLLLVIGGLAGLMHVVLSSWHFPKFCSLRRFCFFYLSVFLVLIWRSKMTLPLSNSKRRSKSITTMEDGFTAERNALMWLVDLCHQANEEDEDEEENSSQQPLLESSKNKPGSMNTDSFWSCCSFRGIHVGGRQKFVITVVVLIFFLMLSFAVIIWIGVGKNPIRSSVAARVYVDFFASAILILGGALGCYGKLTINGLLLFLKLRNVRSETASSEMRKVAGLAVVSVVCFTSSAAVALLTDVPVSGWWLLSVPALECSSVPSAFVLWAMRELPTPITITQAQSRAVTFFCYGAEGTQNPRHWVAATTSNNQKIQLENPYYDILDIS